MVDLHLATLRDTIISGAYDELQLSEIDPLEKEAIVDALFFCAPLVGRDVEEVLEKK